MNPPEGLPLTLPPSHQFARFFDPGATPFFFFFSLLPYKAKKLMRFWAFGDFMPKHQ